MPGGKPAGMACVQLDGAGRCRLFGRPERPAVCSSLQPSAQMCGDSRAHAMRWLARLETATLPEPEANARCAPFDSAQGADGTRWLSGAEAKTR